MWEIGNAEGTQYSALAMICRGEPRKRARLTRHGEDSVGLRNKDSKRGKAVAKGG